MKKLFTGLVTALLILGLSIPVFAQETTTPPSDSGTGDATQPPADSTQPPADSTQPPADATQPPADATQPPADSTQPPAGTGDATQPPADSEEQPAKELKPKTLHAFILEIKAAENKIILRKGKGKNAVLDAASAVIVLVENNAAKAGVLADLKAGDKVFVLYVKDRGPEKNMKALVILKGKQPAEIKKAEKLNEEKAKEKAKCKAKAKGKGKGVKKCEEAEAPAAPVTQP